MAFGCFSLVVVAASLLLAAAVGRCEAACVTLDAACALRCVCVAQSQGRRVESLSTSFSFSSPAPPFDVLSVLMWTLVSVRARYTSPLAASLFVLTLSSSAMAATTLTYVFTGTYQTLVVPAGVTAVRVQLWGAGGAGSSPGVGGAGAYIAGTLGVVEGETLRIIVGRGGTTSSFGCSGDRLNQGDPRAICNRPSRMGTPWDPWGGGGGCEGGGRSAVQRLVSGVWTEFATAGGGGSAGGFSTSGGAATWTGAGRNGGFQQQVSTFSNNNCYHGNAGGGGGQTQSLTTSTALRLVPPAAPPTSPTA